MTVYVNAYVDALTGKDASTLLSLSPNLCIVLRGEESNCKPLHKVGIRCPKCGQVIEGRNIFPVPTDNRMLACKCLTVLFRASAFEHDWIIENWNEWRRIKAVVETQLAAHGN